MLTANNKKQIRRTLPIGSANKDFINIARLFSDETLSSKDIYLVINDLNSVVDKYVNKNPVFQFNMNWSYDSAYPTLDITFDDLETDEEYLIRKKREEKQSARMKKKMQKEIALLKELKLKYGDV